MCARPASSSRCCSSAAADSGRPPSHNPCVERSRVRVTGAVVAGVLVPPALALLGYVAAGRPHVDCGETERTEAFYRVAAPFFGLAGLAGVAALVLVARTKRDDGRPWLAETFAAIVGLVALDGLLPGGLHHPAGAVVAVLGLAALVGSVITWPVTAGLVVAAGASLVRHRYRGVPDRRERRIYLLLLAWALVAVLPAVILDVSLNADPLCFSF